jgi:cellulose synthase/poly-beta-1,6-N-acetylglucosamine synthase-like glycosyltransferase
LKFSIIIPSYNQDAYIEETLKNCIAIKNLAGINQVEIEILLFDAVSNNKVQQIIEKYKSKLDIVKIEKDKGQFDAINKGIEQCTGTYWTWLNTDDTIDIDGFYELVKILKSDKSIDYIYGSIDYIDAEGKFMQNFPTRLIDYKTLVTKVPGIFQQGSFFKKSFTNGIGLLKNYNCCFDYEYVLRCMKNNAKVYACNFKVANFRQHSVSKTGSLTTNFIKDQLLISEKYGRKWFHFLTWFSYLRLFKHQLFPRK